MRQRNRFIVTLSIIVAVAVVAIVAIICFTIIQINNQEPQPATTILIKGNYYSESTLLPNAQHNEPSKPLPKNESLQPTNHDTEGNLWDKIKKDLWEAIKAFALNLMIEKIRDWITKSKQSRGEKKK